MNRLERHQETGRWRVADVMATDVITVDKYMPYKHIARPRA
jgi:hypothetical protein